MNFGSLTEVGFYIQHLIGISYSLIHTLIFPIACKVATIDRGLEPSTLQRLDKSQALRVYRLYYYYYYYCCYYYYYYYYYYDYIYTEVFGMAREFACLE